MEKLVPPISDWSVVVSTSHSKLLFSSMHTDCFESVHAGYLQAPELVSRIPRQSKDAIYHMQSCALSHRSPKNMFMKRHTYHKTELTQRPPAQYYYYKRDKM